MSSRRWAFDYYRVLYANHIDKSVGCSMFKLTSLLAELLRNNIPLVEGSVRSFNVVLGFRTLVDRDVVAGAVAHVVLSRPDDFVLGVVEELVPVGHPAGSSRNHEEDREHVGGETHCFVDDT